MPENNPREMEQIKHQAKAEDQNAREANQMVNGVVSSMTPQRHYSEDKAQNKR